MSAIIFFFFRSCSTISYPLDIPIITKIETICKEVYGADGVDLSPQAQQDIARYTRQVREAIMEPGFISYLHL